MKTITRQQRSSRTTHRNESMTEDKEINAAPGAKPRQAGGLVFAVRAARQPVWDGSPKLSFPERNQIGEQAIGAGHPVRKFPEKYQAGINEIAFAVLRDRADLP